MKTINVDLSTGEALNLPIGRQGENAVTQVVFDFSGLKTEFGSGTLTLSVQRPKEYTPYAQELTVSGTDATWLVNETDTGVSGCGQIQLTYTVSSKVAKTVVYKYTVYPSIGADGEYPIPGQTWQEEIEEDIAEIKEDLSDLQAEIEGGGSGMSADFKQALHNILEKVAFVDEYGQTYLDALDSAMYPPVTAISLNTNSLSFASLNSTQQLTATTTPVGGNVIWSSSDPSVATVSSTGLVTSKAYGNATITATSGNVSATCSVAVVQATLSSISAVYTQSSTVYTTDSLDVLKTDLVVTAHWNNSTTSTVSSDDYTLTGTLTAGTSTITVSYGGKTTTFNVTVTSDEPTIVTAINLPYGAYIDTEYVPTSLSLKYLIGVQYLNPNYAYGNTYRPFAGVNRLPASTTATEAYWHVYFENGSGTNTPQNSQSIDFEYGAYKNPNLYRIQRRTANGDATVGVANLTTTPFYFFVSDGENKIRANEELTEDLTTGTFSSVSGTDTFSAITAENPIDSFYIGKVNQAGSRTTAEFEGGIKVFCFKVYDTNDNLLVNMHPAVYHGTVGMYDAVRNKFCAALGTGATYDQ